MLVSVTPTRSPVFDGVNMRPRTVGNLSTFGSPRVVSPGSIQPARVVNVSAFGTPRVEAGAPPGYIRPAVFSNVSQFPVGVPGSGENRLTAVASQTGSDTTRAISSSNLTSWVNGTTPTFDSGSGVSWRGIAYSPELGLWVSVGNGGSEPQHLVMTSPDGQTWTQRTAAHAAQWNDVIWVSELSLFVAVASTGASRVMTSPDGFTWTARTASDTGSGWWAVEYSPELNLLVAVAESGTARIMTSPDGVTWTSRTAPVTQQWQDVAWSPLLGKFLAVANNIGTQLIQSTDGITWTSVVYSGISSYIWLRCIWVGAPFNKFFICAENSDGVIAQSSDGATWSQNNTLATEIRDIAWSEGFQLLFFCARTGTGNRIRQSVDGAVWTATNSTPDREWFRMATATFIQATGTRVEVAPAAGQIRPVVVGSSTSVPSATVSVAPAPGLIRPGLVTNTSTFAAPTVQQALIYGETVTKYTNDLGIGDRRQFITVTARVGLFDQKNGAAFVAGNEDVLIDGDLGLVNELRFAAGVTDGWIKFDFTHGTAHSSSQKRVIDEFTLWMTSLSSLGNWRWHGSDDDSTYSPLGAAFDLHGGSGVGGGGSAAQFPFSNTVPYLYYKLVQESGTTVASRPKEFEFKIRAFVP